MSHSKKQSEYWDSILDPQNLTEGMVREFDLPTELEFYQTPAQDYAYTQMGDLHGKRVLEIGCGMGVNSILLTQKGAQVTAIDISHKRLVWVNQLLKKYNYPTVTLLQADGQKLPFGDDTFDMVYSNAVLIHLDKIMTAKEVYRVLKPGGAGIFVEPMKYHPLVNIYRYTLGPRIWRKIASYFSFKDIKGMGECFDTYTHKEFYLFSFISFYWEFSSHHLVKFKKSLKRWTVIDNIMYTLSPVLRRLSWFVVICGYKK